MITINDPNYPALLKNVYDPPQKLYFRGDIKVLSGDLIAFVGTRNFTSYGAEVVARLIEDLSLCGVVIVSGLARGIDTLAHEAALRCGLLTVAVLGTGIDNIYPEENLGLADRILAHGGCIISEYPGDEPAQGYRFPMRNRIVAGLSLATVVVEAPESSGALITAKRANEENRDVFAVPGDIDREESVGCNRLIQSLGARVVMSGADIIRELKIQPSFFDGGEVGEGAAGAGGAGAGGAGAGGAGAGGLPEEVSKILSVIPKNKPVGIEDIIKSSGTSVQVVHKSLSLLEIHGFVLSTSNGFYLRKC